MNDASALDPRTDLPPPSAELYLLGAIAEALLAELPPERRRAAIDRISGAFDRHEEMVSAIGPRPEGQQPALAEARRRARTWWSWLRPLLLTAAARP